MQTIKNGYIQYLENQPIGTKNIRIKKRVVSDYLLYLSRKNVNLIKTKTRHIEDYLRTLKHLKASTYNEYVYILRDFYRYLYSHHFINIDWGDYLIKKKTPQTLPRNIPLDLMMQLCTPTEKEYENLKQSIIAIRNQAILEFLFSTGVRSAELLEARLKYLSYDLTECFIPTKKKGLPRYVYLGKPAREALSKYLKKRGISSLAQLNKQQDDYIFVNKYNNNISHTTLRRIIINLAIKRIGTSVTPHMIRHTFATEMLRSSGCLRSLQIMLGHKAITTTQIYTHLDINDQIVAIDDFHPRSQDTSKVDKQNKKEV